MLPLTSLGVALLKTLMPSLSRGEEPVDTVVLMLGKASSCPVQTQILDSIGGEVENFQDN